MLPLFTSVVSFWWEMLYRYWRICTVFLSFAHRRRVQFPIYIANVFFGNCLDCHHLSAIDAESFTANAAILTSWKCHVNIFTGKNEHAANETKIPSSCNRWFSQKCAYYFRNAFAFAFATHTTKKYCVIKSIAQLTKAKLASFTKRMPFSYLIRLH